LLPFKGIAVQTAKRKERQQSGWRVNKSKHLLTIGAAKFTVNRRVGDSILMEVFVDGKPYRGSFGSREKSRSETPTFRNKDTKPSAVPFSPESKRPTFSLPISQGVLTMSNSCAAI
jgi:hypothetical protein